MAREQIKFQVPLSLGEFFYTDKTNSLACGPVGSTKTSAGILRIAYEASRMAKCKDGIRRSKAIWVRNTREQLNDTSIPDFLKWFPSGVAGVFQKTGLKFLLKFGDVECLVLFRGLDDANDVRRVLSLQASFAVFDEFREIHPDVFEAVQGRLGRYPDGMMVPHRPEWGVDDKGNPRMGCVDDYGRPMKKLWGMSNPPDADTYWENLLTDPPANTHVTIQPGGMDPKADWLKYLPSNYYEDLMLGKTEEYINVYIHAKFGRSLSGQPVFKAFEAPFHIAKNPLHAVINGIRPIIIGLDFGLTPAAVICQQDMRGRFMVLDEIVSEGMGIVRFCDMKLKPLIAERWPGAPVLVVGDPAGRQRAQTDESTVYDILKQKGFQAIPAMTNSIVARIAAVDELLGRQIDGNAGFLVDPRCKAVIGALRGKYRYRMKTTGEYDITPEKNDASHIADALQYACLHVDAMSGGKMRSKQTRAVVKKSAKGWT